MGSLPDFGPGVNVGVAILVELIDVVAEGVVLLQVDNEMCHVNHVKYTWN